LTYIHYPLKKKWVGNHDGDGDGGDGDMDE